jgi:hypothetical protein
MGFKEVSPLGIVEQVGPAVQAPPARLDEPRPFAGRALATLLAILRPLGLYAASRVVVLCAVGVTARIHPGLSMGEAMKVWDGGWYIDTAIIGYQHQLPMADGHVAQNFFAFFPLYPMSIRLFHGFGLSPLKAALVVSALAGAIAAVLVWFLLERLWGRDAADRGTALFCFFPGSVVFSLAYSEALMLALAAGCLLALVSRRWLIAGVLAALGTATRPNALALVAACAWAAGVAVWKRREWRALLAPALAPVGFVTYMAFVGERTGMADAWYRTQHEAWGERISPLALWHHLQDFVEHPFANANVDLRVYGAVFIAITLILLIRARPPGAILAYTIVVVVLALGAQTLGARPRFVLTAFPLVAVLGRYVRGVGFSTLLGASAVALGALTVLFCTMPLATP